MRKIALFGNPNTGKSSIFNHLTGLSQKVGNFPGVTVDKHHGVFELAFEMLQVIDFPGTYSIFPKSKDEELVYNVLSNPSHEDFPDVAIITADASNLERNLFLFSQIYELGIPTILALNMNDIAKRRNIEIDLSVFKNAYSNVPIILCNPRIKSGINELKEAIKLQLKALKGTKTFILPSLDDSNAIMQSNIDRSKKIQKITLKLVKRGESKIQNTEKIDQILLHPFFGYVILFGILFGVFQLIFSFSSIPMDAIDNTIGYLSFYVKNHLPTGVLNDLVAQAIIPGLGGIVIFIPQIALLFFALALMEESGYMARVVFLMDRLMRPFGMAGRSVVPLISSVACAIPGIMAARTINNPKERLITILVAPLMSCSARIPVFTVLISLVIPKQNIWGIINLQGLVMFSMYALGIIFALIVAFILHLLFKTKDKSYLLLELPTYKAPRWKNVGLELLEKVKLFVFDAGKIILAISILLWCLASFGGGDKLKQALKTLPKPVTELEKIAYNQKIASLKLEYSYIGSVGKVIEPVIAPLGYDWKIGISLLASFAAREVFVGTMATIYSVESDGENHTALISKMRNDTRKDGKPVWTLATGLSLMIFYVFAMQCMATLSVVKRETKTWKWPIIQTAYLGVLAYLMALITYSIF